PQRRISTKRQVKLLSSDGILTTRNAIQSISDRKRKERVKDEKKLVKQFEKTFGYRPTARPQERIQQAIENELRSREAGEDFFIDN
ncbi:hypothetical protein BJX63DRAFT_438731, partial [Aspergillus granulosus]